MVMHVDESIICPSQHINSSLSLETLSNQLEALSKDVNANMAAIKSFTEHANAYNTEIDNLKIQDLKLTNENSDLKNVTSWPICRKRRKTLTKKRIP